MQNMSTKQSPKILHSSPVASPNPTSESRDNASSNQPHAEPLNTSLDDRVKHLIHDPRHAQASHISSLTPEDRWTLQSYALWRLKTMLSEKAWRHAWQIRLHNCTAPSPAHDQQLLKDKGHAVLTTSMLSTQSYLSPRGPVGVNKRGDANAVGGPRAWLRQRRQRKAMEAGQAAEDGRRRRPPTEAEMNDPRAFLPEPTVPLDLSGGLQKQNAVYPNPLKPPSRLQQATSTTRGTGVHGSPTPRYEDIWVDAGIYGLRVPSLVKACVEFLSMPHVITTQGLFRTPGAQKRVAKLWSAYFEATQGNTDTAPSTQPAGTDHIPDTSPTTPGTFDFHAYHADAPPGERIGRVHDVASLLTSYLHKSNVSLLTPDLYELFLTAYYFLPADPVLRRQVSLSHRMQRMSFATSTMSDQPNSVILEEERETQTGSGTQFDAEGMSDHVEAKSGCSTGNRTEGRPRSAQCQVDRVFGEEANALQGDTPATKPKRSSYQEPKRRSRSSPHETSPLNPDHPTTNQPDHASKLDHPTKPDPPSKPDPTTKKQHDPPTKHDHIATTITKQQEHTTTVTKPQEHTVTKQRSSQQDHTTKLQKSSHVQSTKKEKSTTSSASEQPLASPYQCRAEGIRHCFMLVPDGNRDLCEYLLHFLANVADHSEENLMDATNLALIFAPNILAPVNFTRFVARQSDTISLVRAFIEQPEYYLRFPRYMPVGPCRASAAATPPLAGTPNRIPADTSTTATTSKTTDFLSRFVCCMPRARLSI